MAYALFFSVLTKVPIYYLFDRKRVLHNTLIFALSSYISMEVRFVLFEFTSIPFLVTKIGVAFLEALVINLFMGQKFPKALLISSIQNLITTLLDLYFYRDLIF